MTSPPPDFISCATEAFSVAPGRIEGSEAFTGDCGASGPHYAIFTFKANQKKMRAWCYALEDQSIRSEAR